jgi:hypothetical protein
MALATLLSVGFTSCITDDSTEANASSIPTLSITGSDAETMPVYNFDLGNDIVIKPEINYTGDEADLTYKWQVGTYNGGVKGDLEDVSTERDLSVKLKTGGAYYFHFTATDGRVGQSCDYKVNLNRSFEEGYLLTSFDADGKGNLTFIKIPTPEEIEAGKTIVPVEHCLTLMNEDISEDDLVKAVSGSVNLWDGTTSSVLSRILVSTKESCYFLDPNNFTALSEIKYSDVYPGFKATDFMPDDTNTPYAYDSKMKKFAHLNLKYMFPYEYSYYKDFTTEGALLCKYLSYGSETSRTFYMDYTNNKVSIFSAYASYFDLDTYFPNTGSLLNGQQLLTAFTNDDGNSAYIMAKSQTTGQINLWTNTDTYYYLKENEFTGQSFAATSNSAVPEQGTQFVYTPTYDRYYYSIGSSVYVFLASNQFTLPDKNQYALNFDSNEEVTFIDVELSTDELYVATYNKQTQRGSFYIYDCKDVRTDNSAAVKAKKEYKNCCGRITYLMYKPSIQS